MSFVLNAFHTGSYWLMMARSTPLPEDEPGVSSYVLNGDYRDHIYADVHMRYRIFNEAEFEVFWDDTTPPSEGDAADETNATLPYTTTAEFGDGTWYLVCDWFNGVLPSGFLTVGPSGETYLRIDISGGVEVGAPPRGPTDWRLEPQASGAVRIIAMYDEAGSLRADTWAIAYSTDGSAPAADAPDVTQSIGANGMQVLNYDLPTQPDGTVVNVRLQTRRSAVYSENSTVLTATAIADGPTAPTGGERWPGGVGGSD